MNNKNPPKVTTVVCLDDAASSKRATVVTFPPEVATVARLENAASSKHTTVVTFLNSELLLDSF